MFAVKNVKGYSDKLIEDASSLSALGILHAQKHKYTNVYFQTIIVFSKINLL